MMKKTIIRRELEMSLNTAEHLHPLLQRIYAARGIRSSEELEHELKHLLPWHSLRDIHVAAELLAFAVMQQKRILVVGDFDADGATGTAVAVRALKSFGAQHVRYLVPNRFSFGYGLTPGLVEAALQDTVFRPEMIITVDNGIANHAGVRLARDAGITVVITDHHLSTGVLPDAHAIVNPNQPDDLFPSKNIAGVGVIFYVMLALRHQLRAENWFHQQNLPDPNLSQLLDIVALGTVADVVPLDRNNRILVQQGVQRIRAGRCVPGISALIEISQRQQTNLVTADLGFAIAPRLNAAGRLDDMSLGIECLLCDDLAKARQMAARLNQLNQERRVIERDMQQQAMQAVDKICLPGAAGLPLGLCLFEPSWHQGVIGIVAGRMKERLYRPVIAFALENAESAMLKGSARSIPGVHIRDVLADIAARYPQMIEKFGGHAMAAGLLLHRDQFDAFSAAFQEALSARISEKELQHVIPSDGALRPEEHTLTIAEMIKMAGPWGQGFPEPTFDGVFSILDQRIVGTRHLKLTLGCGERVLPAIAFNVDLTCWPDHRMREVKVAYRMDINHYQGRQTVQLIVEHLEQA